MKNKWLVSIVVVSLLLNIIMVSFVVRDSVMGQSEVITIPSLTKGQGYELQVNGQPRMTCVDLENQLGLKRGDVLSISTDPYNGTLVKFSKDVTLTSTQVQSATDIIKGLIPSIVAK